MSYKHDGHPDWRRSSRCVSDHHCAEAATTDDGILLRNSQHPEHVLRFTKDQWRDFLRMVRSMPGPER